MITQPDSYFRAAAMESSTPGFAFKKRLEHVDWRKIGEYCHSPISVIELLIITGYKEN